MILSRLLTFLLGSLTVTLIVLLFWIYLFLLTLVLCYNGFPSIGKFWSCCLSFHWVSVKVKTGCPITTHSLRLFSRWLESSSLSFEKCSTEDILKLSAYAAASEFCEWVQVGTDAYILHCKYQVKSQSSLRFSAACAAAIVQSNHLFRLYQENKSESKVNLRQASNRCKRVLEAVKLAYANNTKSITSEKLGSRDFWRIANSVLDKDKSAIPPLFNAPEVRSSASDKAKYFSKNFSKNSNLDDSGTSLPVFPSRTNRKRHGISLTPKMVKKVNEPWFIQGVWSWLYSSGGSKELWTWTWKLITSWTLQ